MNWREIESNKHLKFTMMKNTTLFLIGIFLIALVSCQDKKDVSTVEIKTSLNIDIPLIAENQNNVKSAGNINSKDYTFEGAGSFSASSIASSESEIFNIQNIKLVNGSFLSFSGINTNNEIYSLILEWGYKSTANGEYMMQEPIDLLKFENTLKDEIFSVKMDDALTEMISSINGNKDNVYTIRITGESNFDLSSIAKLNVPVIIETETPSVHFELF